MASNAAVPHSPPMPIASGGTNLADIHDIKGLERIPTGWEWLYWTLGILVAIALLWALWKWVNKKLAAPKPKVVIPAHRRAKDRLRGALELISNPYAFCSLVSDVLREYLEERFSFHAPDRTTEEFLNELWTSDRLDPDQKTALQQFLTECDLVKFARYEPEEQSLRQLLETANRFVDETAETGQPSVPPVPVSPEGANK